jgi:hypothetical protein
VKHAGRRGLRAAGSLGVLLFLAPPVGPARAEGWELLYQRGDLRVYEEASGKLRTFKAEGTIAANLFDVLAVLSDTDRRSEWVRDLAESRLVEGDVQSRVVIHERFDLPWPCNDRDSVVESVIAPDFRNLELSVRYHEVAHVAAPLQDGVTRMPVVRGSMYFRYVDEDRSFARIVMTLDVGGLLPGFVVNYFVRNAPATTLDSLLRQVERTRGQYAAFVSKVVESARAQAERAFEAPAALPPRP